MVQVVCISMVDHHIRVFVALRTLRKIWNLLLFIFSVVVTYYFFFHKSDLVYFFPWLTTCFFHCRHELHTTRPTMLEFLTNTQTTSVIKYRLPPLGGGGGLNKQIHPLGSVGGVVAWRVVEQKKMGTRFRTEQIGQCFRSYVKQNQSNNTVFFLKLTPSL